MPKDTMINPQKNQDEIQQKSTYFLYVDESGDPGRYLDQNNNVIANSSKYFTLAGIIIDHKSKTKMNQDIHKLATQYLPQSILDTVKLHYQPLIQNAPPYNLLSDEDRLHLADGMFKIICDSPCALLSVTINLEKHFSKYEVFTADPKAYAMLMMLERFQDFLVSKDAQGKVIYERFNKKERKNVEKTIKILQSLLSFRHYVELSNIKGNIQNGDPLKEPILQLADFFAYATQIMYRNNGQKRRRWDSIKMKYFNRNGAYYYKGNVSV